MPHNNYHHHTFMFEAVEFLYRKFYKSCVVVCAFCETMSSLHLAFCICTVHLLTGHQSTLLCTTPTRVQLVQQQHFEKYSFSSFNKFSSLVTLIATTGADQQLQLCIYVHIIESSSGELQFLMHTVSIC